MHVNICMNETTHVLNLIKPEFSERLALPYLLTGLSFPIVQRNIARLSVKSRQRSPMPPTRRQRNAKFLHASCRAPPYFEPFTSSSPPSFCRPRLGGTVRSVLFIRTFISATGYRLLPLICKYSLTVIRDTLARLSVRSILRLVSRAGSWQRDGDYRVMNPLWWQGDRFARNRETIRYNYRASDLHSGKGMA